MESGLERTARGWGKVSAGREVQCAPGPVHLGSSLSVTPGTSLEPPSTSRSSVLEWGSRLDLAGLLLVQLPALRIDRFLGIVPSALNDLLLLFFFIVVKHIQHQFTIFTILSVWFGGTKDLLLLGHQRRHPSLYLFSPHKAETPVH